jgi:hypothetical protein
MKGPTPCLPLLLRCCGTQSVLVKADRLHVRQAGVSLSCHGDAASAHSVQPQERHHNRGP